MASALAGMARFALDTIYKHPPCGQPDDRPAIVAEVHPYYFSAIQVTLGLLVNVVVSLLTKGKPKNQVTLLCEFWVEKTAAAIFIVIVILSFVMIQLAGLTFWTVHHDNSDCQEGADALHDVPLETRAEKENKDTGRRDKLAQNSTLV